MYEYTIKQESTTNTRKESDEYLKKKSSGIFIKFEGQKRRY